MLAVYLSNEESLRKLNEDDSFYHLTSLPWQHTAHHLYPPTAVEGAWTWTPGSLSYDGSNWTASRKTNGCTMRNSRRGRQLQWRMLQTQESSQGLQALGTKGLLGRTWEEKPLKGHELWDTLGAIRLAGSPREHGD